MAGPEAPIPCRVTQTVETAWTFERQGERLVLHREETANGVNLVVVSETRRAALVSLRLDRPPRRLPVRYGIAARPHRLVVCRLHAGSANGRDRRRMPREAERRRWWTDGLR